METKKNYERWLSSNNVTEEEKLVLKEMSKKEIDDAFFKDIEFGTAGMRGIIGPGTNRINLHTVGKATVGFGKYLLEVFPSACLMGVVIAHDNRHLSRELTLSSADILSKMGLKVYIFDSLRPTPELSFAVRYLKCAGGIMITASHNSKEYNGYKVYDETGCQLVPDKISHLINIINEQEDELNVVVPEAVVKGEIITLDNQIDDEYVKLIKTVQENPDLDKSKIKIVYTPQHGTSYVNAMRVFKECGYNIIPVEEQCTPDPDFSATLSPNPENPQAYVRAIELAKEVNADLVLTTDPDGDRVGLAFKDSRGEFQLLTGNQSAALLIDYLFSQRKAKKTLSRNGVMYNTIVTSSFGKQIAKSYGVETEQFLTGFKFIGDRIHHYELKGSGPTFEFGYEESYGCLVKPFVRDKDGIQAILLYAEMTLFNLINEKRLDVAYEELQSRFSYHQDECYSIEFEGSSGQKKMNNMLSDIRHKPFSEILGIEVVQIDDYLTSISSLMNGEFRHLTLPKSDVLKFYLDDGSFIAIRPSGTEPKCKFYISTTGKNKDEVYALPKKLFIALKMMYAI